MKALLVAAALLTALPAYAGCERSPFTGLIFCDDGSDPFANERLNVPKRTHCETSRDNRGNLVTDCQEE